MKKPEITNDYIITQDESIVNKDNKRAIPFRIMTPGIPTLRGQTSSNYYKVFLGEQKS
tara:strand:+ start:232 stop:405 length:174 start_codon:yes stop_codon:yes gene_type:complete